MKCFPQAADIDPHSCQFFSTTHFVPFLPILFQELFSIEPLYNNWSHTSSNFPLYSKNVDIHCLFSHLCTKLCTISTRKCAVYKLIISVSVCKQHTLLFSDLIISAFADQNPAPSLTCVRLEFGNTTSLCGLQEFFYKSQ